MDKAQLLERYAANLAVSARRNHYLSYATHFLNHTVSLDRASIDDYITSLRKKYKPGTVNFIFRVIRRLFAVNQLPWEYRQGEAPVIGQRDEYRPQLAPALIKMMISAALKGELSAAESAFLALSTTYGLRREEMANLRPDDINFKAGSIYVATVKHGRERYHLIPEEIRPYLTAHDFSGVYAVSTVSQAFNRILKKSLLSPLIEQRIGWHSIRRAVLDGLINNGVNILAARTFLRWKGADGEMAMPARYYGNVVIGLQGTMPFLEEAKGDKEIFEKHPFLLLWVPGGENASEREVVLSDVRVVADGGVRRRPADRQKAPGKVRQARPSDGANAAHGKTGRSRSGK